MYTDDHNKTKAFLKLAREGEENYKKSIREYESLLVELQKERENDKREIVNIKKEFEKNIKLKEIEIENATFKVTDFDKSLENKKSKITKLKQDKDDIK